MSKSKPISWLRIKEMFRFISFDMYGKIGATFTAGLFGVVLIKRLKNFDFQGNTFFLS